MAKPLRTITDKVAPDQLQKQKVKKDAQNFNAAFYEELCETLGWRSDNGENDDHWKPEQHMAAAEHLAKKVDSEIEAGRNGALWERQRKKQIGKAAIKMGLVTGDQMKAHRKGKKFHEEETLDETIYAGERARASAVVARYAKHPTARSGELDQARKVLSKYEDADKRAARFQARIDSLAKPVKEEEELNEKNWIAGAIKHPGAMTAAAKREGVSNSEYEQEHKGDSGKAGKRARLALTLKKMHHEETQLDEVYKNKATLSAKIRAHAADERMYRNSAEVGAYGKADAERDSHKAKLHSKAVAAGFRLLGKKNNEETMNEAMLGGGTYPPVYRIHSNEKGDQHTIHVNTGNLRGFQPHRSPTFKTGAEAEEHVKKLEKADRGV